MVNGFSDCQHWEQMAQAIELTVCATGGPAGQRSPSPRAVELPPFAAAGAAPRSLAAGSAAAGGLGRLASARRRFSTSGAKRPLSAASTPGRSSTTPQPR